MKNFRRLGASVFVIFLLGAQYASSEDRFAQFKSLFEKSDRAANLDDIPLIGSDGAKRQKCVQARQDAPEKTLDIDDFVRFTGLYTDEAGPAFEAKYDSVFVGMFFPFSPVGHHKFLHHLALRTFIEPSDRYLKRTYVDKKGTIETNFVKMNGRYLVFKTLYRPNDDETSISYGYCWD